MRTAEYRPDVDGLRAVAVLSVVFFHAGFSSAAGGFVGVDVFFVISGFLIARLIRRDIEAGHFSLVAFYERRARRILPALFSVAAATLMASWVFMLPDQFVEFAQSLLSTLFFVSNVWFWFGVNDYFGAAAELSPLLHTWSLSIEEQFYIGFPILMIVLAGATWRLKFLLLFVLTLCSAILCAVTVHWFPAATFFLLPTRAWEIGIGVLLGFYTSHHQPTRWFRDVIGILGLAAILAPVMLFDSRTPFPGTAALAPTLGTAALIWLGTVGGSIANRFLAFKPLVFVGLISYSLYLWHWPVLSFLRIRYAQIELPAELSVAAIIASFFMAVASWRWIEQPFRQISSPGLPTVRVFLQAAAAAAILAAGSIGVWAAGGVPARLLPEIHSIVDAAAEDSLAIKCRGRLPEDGLCRIGEERRKDAPVDFLLWGDSHASAMISGVSEAAAKARLSGEFASNHACATLVKATVREPLHQRRCSEFVSSLVEYLKRREDIAYVIMASRWPVIVEGTLLPGEPGQRFELTSSEKEWSPDRGNADVVAQALPETLKAIARPGRTIIILGSVPEIGWHVPDHLVRESLWDDELPVAPNALQVARRQSRTDALLLQIAAERDDVDYLPVAATMCRPVCATHDGLKAFYYDDDHLTPVGARLFVTPFLTAFWTARGHPPNTPIADSSGKPRP